MNVRMTPRLPILCMLLCLEGSLLLLLASSPVYAQLLPVDADNVREAGQEVILQSETLEYFEQEKRLIAEGKIVIDYGKTRLFADRLEMHTESGIGTAWGNVRLLTPEDDVRASRLDFNLSAEQGLLYNSRGIAAQVYHIAGKRIARVGPKTFEVRHGRVTTCSQATPDWEFRTRKARIGLGQYVTLQHPSFWIKGVPVFYLPYFVFPIRDERTTGFLPPLFGYNTTDGAVVKNEFFWAINDWTDATVGLEYLRNRGYRPEVQFRYAIDPLSDGRVEAAYIRDQDLEETLWRVLIQQRQEFGWGLRGLTQVDLRSERDLVRGFSGDIRQESQVNTLSFGTLTKRFTDSTLTLEGASFDGIPDSGTTDQFRRLPSLQFTQFLTPLFGKAFFAVDASYSRLSATEVVDNTPVQRLDLFPRVTLPLTWAPWMRLTLTGGVRETFYDQKVADTDQEMADADQGVAGFSNTSRELLEVRAHLEGPTLRRRYPGVKAGQAMVHVVTARLDYSYVPEVDQSNLPPFETLDEAQHLLDPLETSTLIDRIAAANYVKISLLNRLFAQAQGRAAPGRLQEVGRLVLSQGLNIYEATEGEGQLVGPLDVETELFLWQRLRLTSALRLDAAGGNLEAASTLLSLTILTGWSIRVGHNYRQGPDVQYISGGVSLPVLRRLRIGYNWRYDGLSGTFRDHVIALLYQAQCWSVDMSLRIRETEDAPFFPNTSFFIQFRLLQF